MEQSIQLTEIQEQLIRTVSELTEENKRLKAQVDKLQAKLQSPVQSEQPKVETNQPNRDELYHLLNDIAKDSATKINNYKHTQLDCHPELYKTKIKEEQKFLNKIRKMIKTLLH